MHYLFSCFMWHRRKEGRKEVVTGWRGQDINHIPGVYYAPIVSLMDTQNGEDEDR